jgi:hypothetical protein
MTDLPEDYLREHYLILLKSARRCAYDLRHAGSELNMQKEKPFLDFEQRAQMWIDIFAPDGVKNYRLDLHNEIFRLELKIKELEKQVVELGGTLKESWIDD